MRDEATGRAVTAYRADGTMTAWVDETQAQHD